jgi:hypothetical protein
MWSVGLSVRSGRGCHPVLQCQQQPTLGNARPKVYRASLRERLPVVAIPLRPSDRDVPLELQAIFNECYRNGGYDDVDYRVAPDPPLLAEDAAWADTLLQEQGKR